MKLPTYFRCFNKKEKTPLAIGGMAGVLAVIIFSVFSLSVIDSYLVRSGGLAAVISAVLVDLTNGDRTSNSTGGLTISPVLTRAAQAKADDMATKGYFAHVSPDGKNSWYWFKQEGYTFTYAGENLAVDFSDSIDVEKAWMNSPTHRANILDGNFTQIGIATAQGVYEGRTTTFVVQMFGTPAEASAPVAAVQSTSLPAEPTTPAFATTKKPAPKVAVKLPAPKPVATTTEAAPAATAAPEVAVAATAPATTVLGTQADSILAPAASWWQQLIASPKATLRYAYFALAGVILILLAFVTEFEFHKRHLRHVTVSAILFVLMIGLFTLASFMFFTSPVVAALR